MYLDGIRRRDTSVRGEGFPWTVAPIRELEDLAFSTPVTFLVGDNGSGKSTLLEALAYGMGAYAIGSVGWVTGDPMLQHAKALADSFFFVRRKHARVKMFLRAEDVFGHVKALLAEAGALEAEASVIGQGAKPNPVAMGMLLNTANVIRAGDPDGRSHGETFLQILEQRLHGGGLYFLDEPETPLSPMRQLALLEIIRACAEAGGQLIIATHSPVLLALPGATIFEIGSASINPRTYDELESIAFMKAFMRNPLRFID